MQVSVISNFFGPEEQSLPRLAELGYRRIEVMRKEQVALDAGELRTLAERCGLELHSVMCWHPGLADEPGERQAQAWRGLVDNIHWCADLGAKVLEVVPMWKGEPDQRDQAWPRAVEALGRGGELAGERGVTLAIEPVNRWETHLVNTLAEGARMAAEVGLDSVRVMGDTHHMHIGERDLRAAVWAAAPYLVHFHFSDNDRQVPGLGQMDLPGLVNTLARVGYTGSLSLSEVSRRPDPELAASLGLRYTQALIAVAKVRAELLGAS